MKVNSVNKKRKKELELYEFRNNYLIYNDELVYEDMYTLEDFFYYVFERDNELPFEDKKEKDCDYTTGRYNAICVEIGEKYNKRHIITSDLDKLDEIRGKNFVISSPITYIGRTRNSKNSRACYGLAFDLDGVGEQQMRDVIRQMKSGFIPKANIVVNSGHGLHLYYLFKNPISLFENIKRILKDLKYELTNIIWNSYTSSIKTRQYQGIFQGFRLPETKTKFGAEVKAFYNKDIPFYSVKELNSYIQNDKNRLSEEKINTVEYAEYKRKRLSLKEAKEKYPDWYERRIVKGEKKGIWNIKPDLYNWWLKKCYSEEIQEGHRYFTLMALAMYGVKCNIPEEQLKKDAYGLFETMERLTTDEDNHFTMEDIEDSLQAYKENYRTFPRKDIEKLTGVSIPANKRNNRKQEVHLMGARAIQEINNKMNNTNWREKNGRPQGSGTKEKIVKKWKKENPNGTMYACQKETGLSKNTVKKWWN